MVFCTEAEVDLDGAHTGTSRHAGERLAASYAILPMVNGAIIAPEFGVPTDAAAKAVLARLFPDRELVLLCHKLLPDSNVICGVEDS